MSISHFFEQNCRQREVSIGLKFVMPRKNEASKAICMQEATLISKEKERKRERNKQKNIETKRTEHKRK